MAVLPGVALDEIVEVLGAGERALQAVSVLVAVVSLAGLVAVILAGLDARRRELAILRSVGAGPRQVLALLAVEGALVTLCGVLLGAGLGRRDRAAGRPRPGPLGAGAARALAGARRDAPDGRVAAGRLAWPQPGARAGGPTGCRWPTGCRRAL